MWRVVFYLVLALPLVIGVEGCERSAAQPQDTAERVATSQAAVHRYVTWDRFEADRWTAAWLIKRFIDPQAEFATVPFGDPIAEHDGTPFDVPGADWMRTPQASTSGVIRLRIGGEDERLDWILSLVRDLELSAWRLDPSESPALIFQDQLHARYTQNPTDQRVEAMFAYLDQVYAHGRVEPPAAS